MDRPGSSGLLSSLGGGEDDPKAAASLHAAAATSQEPAADIASARPPARRGRGLASLIEERLAGGRGVRQSDTQTVEQREYGREKKRKEGEGGVGCANLLQ